MIGNFSERPESLVKLKRHVIERRCDTAIATFVNSGGVPSRATWPNPID